MSPPTIEVSIVDSLGTKHKFSVERLMLDCGLGLIEIRAGEPSFCRGFERALLTLDEGNAVTNMTITGGMASLTDNAVHFVCERATVTPKAKKHLIR